MADTHLYVIYKNVFIKLTYVYYMHTIDTYITPSQYCLIWYAARDHYMILGRIFNPI